MMALGWDLVFLVLFKSILMVLTYEVMLRFHSGKNLFLIYKIHLKTIIQVEHKSEFPWTSHRASNALHKINASKHLDIETVWIIIRNKKLDCTSIFLSSDFLNFTSINNVIFIANSKWFSYCCMTNCHF